MVCGGGTALGVRDPGFYTPLLLTYSDPGANHFSALQFAQLENGDPSVYFSLEHILKSKGQKLYARLGEGTMPS